VLLHIPDQLIFDTNTLKDYKQAVYWYQKAADQGYAEAQSILGVMYAMPYFLSLFFLRH
jgi:TPR repeat protein